MLSSGKRARSVKHSAVLDSRAAVSKPLYGQVRELLLGRIGRGEWAPGESLPNEFVLASQFEVSVGTIRRAIEGLEESGVVVRKQGRGTYISGQGAQALQNKFTNLRSVMGGQLHLAYQVLDVVRREATLMERNRLMCSEREEVIEIRQRVQVEPRCIGIECALVTARMFPELNMQANLNQHLYPLFSEHGVLVTRADERVSAGSADAQMAEQLEITPGQPVLKIERLAYALNNQPIEWRRSAYIAGEVSCAASI